MIIGHQKQWQFLKKSVKLGKISHAYLFSGQEKLGKKTLALEFAKLINCQETDFSKKPCQICLNCKEIEKACHPDLILISPIGQEIKIGQIRDLIYYLSLKPYSAPFKVAIIEKAHLMNQEAQNSFLKTLEEPKANSILILITEYPQMLLETILSRVEKIKFYPLNQKEIEKFLREKGAKIDQAKYLSQISLGRPGIALEFFLNPGKLKEREEKIEELKKIINSNLAIKFQLAKELARNQDLKEILESWLIYFRSLLISKIEGQNLDFSLEKIQNFLKILEKIIFLISTTNINKRLALEFLMLNL